MSARRRWSIVLILVLILGMVPFRSMAASDENGGEIWESDLQWTFTGGDTLTISGTGEMPDFENGTPWYEYKDAIVHLVIEQGVSNIGASAFQYCTALESVSLPEELKQIGASAFAYCRNLAAVVIPDTVETIGGGAFAGCTALRDVTLPENLQRIENSIFYECENLKNVNIPGTVEAIGDSAFYGCTALRNVTLPSKVQQIGSSAFNGCSLTGRIAIPATVTELGTMAFGRCYEIESFLVAADNPVYVSDKEGVIYTKDGTKLIEAPALMDCGSYTVPEGVTEIEAGAFGFCKWIYKVNLPQSLKTIGSSAFFGCGALSEIQLPQNLTGLGMAVFYGCSLTEITIPEQVKCVNTHAFRECTSLKTVTVLGEDTIIDPLAFVGCTKLERVEVSEMSTRYSNDAQGLLYNKEKTELIFVPLAKSGKLELPETVEKIGPRAVQNCRNLTQVTFPETVTEIGYEAFWNCTGLQSVYFEGDAPTIGYNAFQYEFTTEDGEEKTENIPGLTLYYQEGKNGWETPLWNGYPTATWKKPHVHDYSYQVIVTAPTCVEQGYTSHICKCGEHYEDDYKAALGHSFQNGVCTRCGAKDPDWVPPTEPNPTEPKPTEPKPSEPKPIKNPFVDVAQGQYYYDAVLWAVDRGITAGVDATHFDPNGTCTRAQVVAFLWRSAGKPEPKAARNPFVDVSSGDYFYKAVLWAAENGIVYGTDATHFSPDEACTRAQVVAFLHRYQQKPGHGTANPFRDVASGSYYYDAVLWAAENGVVYGTDTTHFSPNAACTRAQIVTFLYRLLHK